ncbi:MAG: hypothetical protein ABIE94_03910 [archaeon]
MQKKRKNHTRKSHKNKLLAYCILVFLVFSIVNTVFLTIYVNKAIERRAVITTAKVTGSVGFCINTPPSLSLSCLNITDQNEDYSCQITYSDPNSGDNLTFNSTFINGSANDIFTISGEGWINFTPGAFDVGNHSFNITINDNSGCGNSMSWAMFNLTVDNLNDPPYLILNIPDQEFEQGHELSAFSLNEYFIDPDGDPMTFSVTSNTNYVIVDILETSRVILSTHTCGKTEYILFNATDIYNASAESNPIMVTCIIPQTETVGGSGGGSGSIREECISDWVCGSWETCRENSTQRKICLDKNGCKDTRYFQRNCTYIKSCFNGKKDLNEEGVDCGGPCRPCKCLEDWNCSNWTECRSNSTQIRTCNDKNECGTFQTKPVEKRKCDYFAHCHNGIKDEDETDIDCGGNCAPCKGIEVPDTIGVYNQWLINLIAVLVAVVVALLIVYRVFHKQLKKAMIRAKFLLARKVQKVILLENHTKAHLLKDLFKLEKFLQKHLKHESKKLKKAEHHALSLGREYFKYALGVPREVLLSDLEKALEKKVPYAQLRSCLKGFFEKLNDTETGTIKMDSLGLLLVVEELLELINLTADTHAHDLRRRIKGFSPSKEKSSVDMLRKMCFDVYIALQFDETKVAQRKYLKILSVYEDLTESDRGKVFRGLLRLEKEIEFADSIFIELKGIGAPAKPE